jgi:hypothetical protein
VSGQSPPSLTESRHGRFYRWACARQTDGRYSRSVAARLSGERVGVCEGRQLDQSCSTDVIVTLALDRDELAGIGTE